MKNTQKLQSDCLKFPLIAVHGSHTLERIPKGDNLKKSIKLKETDHHIGVHTLKKTTNYK